MNFICVVYWGAINIIMHSYQDFRRPYNFGLSNSLYRPKKQLPTLGSVNSDLLENSLYKVNTVSLASPLDGHLCPVECSRV